MDRIEFEQLGLRFDPPRHPATLALAKRQCFRTDSEYRQYLEHVIKQNPEPSKPLLGLAALFDRHVVIAAAAHFDKEERNGTS